MSEKRISSLPSVRVTERTEIALMRAAARDGRELSDYIRRVLELHLWGHEPHSSGAAGDEHTDRASHCDARST